MKNKGYVLIELLAASALLSVVWFGLCVGLVQGLRAERNLHQSARVYNPVRVFGMKAEKDLRNAVNLQDFPFEGRKDEMSFPVLETGRNAQGETTRRLFRVEYFLKNGNLVRREQELSANLQKLPASERVVLRNAGKIRFWYSFLNEEEKLEFHDGWSEKPYFGIPRAVEFEIKRNPDEAVFLKQIVLPQGHMGRLTEGLNEGFKS